ncbi:MAG: hemolysin III family protein [Oscillospiraceae bacterium]|nr:hemolysin III family protein [Oscillospiraceae bacterium]
MAAKNLKRYTVGEEIFNSVSHGVSALAAVVGCTVMVTLSVCFGNMKSVVSSLIFGLALVVMYTMSTLYHAFPFEKVKRLFRIFDHSSIPILIAGSYTPFCVIALQGSRKGIAVITVVWRCALAAIAMNVINLEKFEKFTLIIYVVMGWTALTVLKDILAALPVPAFILLLSGGIAYTVGLIFYKMNKIRYMHSVWHLFVTLGSVLHFLCVVIYILPMTYV